MRAGWPARICTAYSTSATFSSSEGWNCTGPAPSQRWAPFTFLPIPGTITASVSPIEPNRSTGVACFTSLRPCRDSPCISARPIAPNSR